MAVTVVPRSSHSRTGTATKAASRAANSRQRALRGPRVPFMFTGWPTTEERAFSRVSATETAFFCTCQPW